MQYLVDVKKPNFDHVKTLGPMSRKDAESQKSAYRALGYTRTQIRPTRHAPLPHKTRVAMGAAVVLAIIVVAALASGGP